MSDADVHTFVDLYRRLSPTDTTCPILRDYFTKATPGLKAYAGKFDVGVRELCQAIQKSPGRYTALEAKLPGLDSASAQVKTIFGRFAKLYPEGRPPGVYFVVGNGIAAGTTTRGWNPLILIGMELSGSVEWLAPTIAHEFVHTQQDYPWIGMFTGGPAFLRGTLLRHSITEGSADFISEMATGEAHHYPYGEAHEAQLWAEFQRDIHGKDYSLWLWNGRAPNRPADRPTDLGYFIGYRITKAYYNKAPNKAQAVRDILSIRDFDEFLAQSGYRGGQP